MAIQLAAAARKAENDATTGLLNSGTLKIYTGAQPDPDAAPAGTLLATFTFAATAFTPAATDDGTNADSAAAAFVATTVTGAATGTAATFEVADSGGARVFNGTVTATAGGGDLTLDNTSIASGQNVTISSFVYRKTQ